MKAVYRFNKMSQRTQKTNMMNQMDEVLNTHLIHYLGRNN
jgi:hypothetical protein